MMTIHVGFSFASVIALLVICCGQNVVVIASSLSNNDNTIQSIRIKRRTASRKLKSSGGSASSFSVDKSAVSGPFYVIRQDVDGKLYAQISETYGMNKYETVSCTEDGHHPVIISCPYGGSSLDINATSEPAKHQISYTDAHGKFKLVLHDDKAAEVKPNFLRNSLPNEEMKHTKQQQVETVYGNEVDAKEDKSSSKETSSSTEESSSSDGLNPIVIASIAVVSVFFMLFFAYCTCCCLVDDDDDEDDDEDDEDEFDDDNQSGKFHDDHTSVTRGLGGSVASLYDVDLSTNEDIDDDLDIDNDDHIYDENDNKKSSPELMNV